jgi:hypothetical protein
MPGLSPAFGHDFSRIPVHSRTPIVIQPKLTINAPGDEYEQEADRISERVMRTPEPPLQPVAANGYSDQPNGLHAHEPLQAKRAHGNDPAATTVPAIVHEVLSSAGQPLNNATRAFMEPRFGHDFSRVRVHTDNKAANAARAVEARAYTSGRDIVFGSGEYVPQHSERQQLLAHELAHVVQQGQTSQPIRIFRQPAPPSSMPTISIDDGGELELETLLTQVAERTDQNAQLRQQLDALPGASSQERDVLSKALDNGRTELIALLERRIIRLKRAIQDLGSKLKPETMMSSPGKPEAEGVFWRLNSYERQIKQHENQLKGLLRWQMRQRIASIDTQIAELDAELALLPPVSDPSAPLAGLLAIWRAGLIQQRKSIVHSLTSGAVEYKQFDSRWGGIKYGTKKGCTNIKEAGCGPASLAILLNYLYAEDPETLTPGAIEFVTPKETAAYAATHGRVCNSGTSGPTMVTQVSTEWPGFRGKSINLAQVITEVRGGNLVIFLCKNCTGKDKDGQDENYGGHFMVLSGVDDKGQTFNVLDPGRKEANIPGKKKDPLNIETITKTQLSQHTGGFWIIEKK